MGGFFLFDLNLCDLFWVSFEEMKIVVNDVVVMVDILKFFEEELMFLINIIMFEEVVKVIIV